MQGKVGRWDGIAAPLFLYAWSLAWILSRSFADLPPGNDSCFYLVAAKGFAAGAPFRDFASPNPEGALLQGPSFFPLLLSLYWRLPDPRLAFLKAAVAALMAAAPAAAYLWLRLRLTPASAFFSSLAFGASYMFIVQGNSIMTEAVYCPLLYAALWLSQRRPSLSGAEADGGGEPSGSGQAGHRGPGPWIAAGLWVALARTRVVGWAFFAAFLAVSAKKGRYRIVAAMSLAAAAWLAWERYLAMGIQVAHYTDRLFSRTYPIQTDVFLGLRALGRNVLGNLFDFTTAIQGHILFPVPYETFAMNPAKRSACLAVFIWSAWGLWLTWRGDRALRPWLAALAASAVPTLVIFQSHDSFRYHLPYFGFFMLFFLAPFRWLAARSTRPRMGLLPAAAAALIALSQAAASRGHDFESEYIDYPRDFAALHDSLAALPVRPQVCFSPDPYYTWLKTGCPSFPDVGNREIADFRPWAEGKTALALCGPGNEYLCERWRREGLSMGAAPFRTAGDWRLYRIEAWPRKPSP